MTIGFWPFLKSLWHEMERDNVFNGAAALAYYMMLSIFPAAIALLSILAFLPIPNLQSSVMDFFLHALPPDAASLMSKIIDELIKDRSSGILSFGLLFTLWAASSGLHAIMQQLNMTYDVLESRPFWKTRGIALILSLLFIGLIIGAFALIIAGGFIENWLCRAIGFSDFFVALFSVVRWVIIVIGLLTGLALIYYFGPDVEQKFRFISPGSLAGSLILIGASLLFRVYVANFGDYAKSYGSLGAVIVLLLWLYNTGLVLLIGSEINALFEHYSPTGKRKGERCEPRQAPALQ